MIGDKKMNIRTNELILYRDFDEDILRRMAEVANGYRDRDRREVLVEELYQCVNGIVTIARDHGFFGNLWQGYLTHLLITNENAFSMSCEKVGAISGSLNDLAHHDLEIFMEAYHMDWSCVEKELGVRFLSLIENYEGVKNRGVLYSHHLRDCIDQLNVSLSTAVDTKDMYEALRNFTRISALASLDFTVLLRWYQGTGYQRSFPSPAQRKSGSVTLWVTSFKKAS